jgi:hypothetical protein
MVNSTQNGVIVKAGKTTVLDFALGVIPEFSTSLFLLISAYILTLFAFLIKKTKLLKP